MKPILRTNAFNFSREEASYIIEAPNVQPTCFLSCVFTGEIFKVDTDTDLLTEEEVIAHWDLVQEADRHELQQYVDETVFEAVKRYQPDGTKVDNEIDAIWIRKWKRLPDGTYIIRSRLCSRGFLDRQKTEVMTRSTTATQLSQRMVLSLSVIFGLTFESWDISGAFLKGLTFEQIAAMLRKKGLPAPQREIFVKPPANVWRLLSKCKGWSTHVSPLQIKQFTLRMLKPGPGLVDAPLAWHMCLETFFIETLETTQSLFDDNFYFSMKAPGVPEMLAATR